jgi:uncharacterized protein (TIGR00369 family)
MTMPQPPEAPAGTGETRPDGWGPEISRTVTWHDPGPTVSAGLRMSGLEYVTAMMEGRLPASPIGRLTGIEPVRVARGDVVYRCVADPSFLNPMGIVHGGLMCTLLDAVAASAVHTTLAPGVGYTSMEIKVNYLRAVRAGDVLTAHGWVTKPGSRVAFAEADLRDADDRVVANASTTCLVLHP